MKHGVMTVSYDFQTNPVPVITTFGLHSGLYWQRLKTISKMERIGIIAGYGEFPVSLARGLKELGYHISCLCFHGQTDKKIFDYCDDHCWVGYAHFGKATRYFKRQKVTRAAMAGGVVKRQFFKPWLFLRYVPDLYTIRLFAPHFIFRTKSCGTDSLLLTCVEAFEKVGTKIVPGTDLVPELLVKRGILTQHVPTKSQWKDIRYGWKMAKISGQHDIGQTVTVKDGTVVAIEAMEGTDECIIRSGTLCKHFVMVKTAKPDQDQRFDLPCIGTTTLELLHKANGKVLAVEAGQTICLNSPEMVDFANKHGIIVLALCEDDVQHEECPFF